MRAEALAAPPTAIHLTTVEDVPRPVAQELVARLSRRVAVPCRLVDGAPGPPIPWLDGREQADADRMLAALEARAEGAGAVLVGVTKIDLGNPIFTFFFGRARQGGAAALVSLARLRQGFYGLPEDEDLTLGRATLEILHELGHVAGLAHCRDYRCVMRFAATVEAIDVRGKTFCDECARLVPPALRGDRGR